MILAYKLPVQLAMKKGDALLHSAVPIGHGKLLNAGIVLRASGSVFHHRTLLYGSQHGEKAVKAASGDLGQPFQIGVANRVPRCSRCPLELRQHS